MPVLTLAPYLIWQRRWADLLRMSWPPILTAVLVALPWSLAIHAREPDFWRFFFWHEHIRRFMADNAQHKESFWFFFLTAPAMFIPWTFVAPAAVPGIKAGLAGRGASKSLLRLCVCWLVLPFLFFSVSNGKLLTYILPCFPPFAVLMAFGLSHGLAQGFGHRLFRWGAAVGAVLFSLILAAFVTVQLVGIGGLRPFGQPWKAVMVVNGLAFLVLFLVWAFRHPGGLDKHLLVGIAPLLLFFVVHYTIPDRTVEGKSPASILLAYQPDIAKAAVVISGEDAIRAVCWYAQRSDVYLIGSAGELDYGLTYPEARHRLLDPRSAAELIRRKPGQTVFIARAKHISRWRDQLPTPVFEDQSGPYGYVLWKY